MFHNLSPNAFVLQVIVSHLMKQTRPVASVVCQKGLSPSFSISHRNILPPVASNNIWPSLSQGDILMVKTWYVENLWLINSRRYAHVMFRVIVIRTYLTITLVLLLCLLIEVAHLFASGTSTWDPLYLCNQNKSKRSICVESHRKVSLVESGWIASLLFTSSLLVVSDVREEWGRVCESPETKQI